MTINISVILQVKLNCSLVKQKKKNQKRQIGYLSSYPRSILCALLCITYRQKGQKKDFYSMLSQWIHPSNYGSKQIHTNKMTLHAHWKETHLSKRLITALYTAQSPTCILPNTRDDTNSVHLLRTYLYLPIRDKSYTYIGDQLAFLFPFFRYD